MKKVKKLKLKKQTIVDLTNNEMDSLQGGSLLSCPQTCDPYACPTVWAQFCDKPPVGKPKSDSPTVCAAPTAGCNLPTNACGGAGNETIGACHSAGIASYCG